MPFLSAEENVPILFFTSHTAVYGLAYGAVRSNKSSDDPIRKLLDCFRLIRDIQTYLRFHRQYIRASWAGSFLQLGLTAGNELEATTSDVPSSQESMLKALAFGLKDRNQRPCVLVTH